MASADDLSALTSSLSSWEFAGYVSVAAVAIGVAGEVTHDFLYWFKSFNWWREKGNKASALLLVMALVAELVIQVKANSISGQIIAFVEKEAADASERAENARLEQDRLKQLVKWRTIEAADFAALVAELKTGKGEIDLAYVPADPESEYFALKIIGDAFIAANKASGALNWHVNLRTWYNNTGTMYFGIAIPGPENEQVRFLRRAFSAAHIEFSTENVPDEVSPIILGSGLAWTPPPKHDAFILIGLKNPPR